MTGRTPNNIVTLDCRRIHDWGSFHHVFAEVFGFPDFYGRNMSAWIDCMADLDDSGTGMTRITVPSGAVLTLRLESVDDFATRCREQYVALLECTAFVNFRRIGQGQNAVLALAFRRTAGESS